MSKGCKFYLSITHKVSSGSTYSYEFCTLGQDQRWTCVTVNPSHGASDNGTGHEVTNLPCGQNGNHHLKLGPAIISWQEKCNNC